MGNKYREYDREYNREYHLKNRRRILEVKSKWRQENKEARLDYARKYRLANPEKLRNKGLQHRYGLSGDEYRVLLIKQSGVCAICSKPETAKRRWRIARLSVDHDHQTGLVRGLLCQRCNNCLTQGDQDILWFNKASTYLEKAKRVLLG